MAEAGRMDAAAGHWSVPAEGRIDGRQLRAVLGLYVGQILRPGIDATTGSRAHPLLLVVLSNGLLGLAFTLNARRCADLPSYLALLFCVAFVLVALSISPDTPEVRQRYIEVLHSKPVAQRTLLAARTAVLMALAGILACCFGLPPLVAAGLHFPSRPGLLLLDLAMLVLGSFAATVVWLSLLLLAARWMSVERVRLVNQAAQALVIIPLLLVSLETVPLGRPGERISLASHPWAELLPSTWFALFWRGDPGWASAAQKAGALLLLGLALLASWKGGLERFYPRLMEGAAAAAERPMRPPLAVRLLGLGRRLRLLGEPASAVASAILTANRREEVARLKALVPRILAVAFFALALTTGGGPLPVAMLAYFGFASVIDGLQAARQSTHAEASWVFLKAPLAGREVVAGVWAAIALRFLALPFALMGVLIFRDHPAPLAGLLAAGYLILFRLVVSAGLLARPALPLSQDQRVVQSFLGLLVGFVLSIAASVGHALAVTLVGFLGGPGMAAAAAGLAGLLLAVRACDRRASAGLTRVEFLR